MIFEILTIFPGMFSSPLEESIVGKARDRGLIQVRMHNIRDFAADRHQMTDDRPFGGGEGMVMKPEPIVSALRAISGQRPFRQERFADPPGAAVQPGDCSGTEPPSAAHSHLRQVRGC